MIRNLAPDDAELLERFYQGVYIDAFAAQREPWEAWQAALRGDAPYRFFAALAVDGDHIVGGVTSELYPRSRCGFITYLAVAPAAQRRGLGRALFDHAATALHERGARAVFGEVKDPRVHGAAALPRIERFVRWGARVVDVRYIQPALGDGLERDRGLRLIVHPPLPIVTGEMVRSFITELFDVTERAPPDAEIRELLDEIDAHAVLDLLGMVPQW